MKKLLFAIVLSVGGSAWCALPQVSDVVLRQVSKRSVRVSYGIDGEAIVTMRLLTNGAPVAAECLWNVTGDVNRKVAAGSHEIVWNPQEAIPSAVLENAQAELTVWDVEVPPTWCGVDLREGSAATSYPVSYYATEADVPFGPTNDCWKEDRLLLRKVGPTDGAGFPMGAVAGKVGECYHRPDVEMGMTVWLTKPVWIGIYEVTQGQWLKVMGGTNPTLAKHQTDPRGTGGVRRPVDNVTLVNIRGNADWPTDKSVASESFAGQLRQKTGLAFDLPTEAQWEYAARAGQDIAFIPYPFDYFNEPRAFKDHNGVDHPKLWGLTNQWADLPPARYAGNRNTLGFDGTADVGTYVANAWGFYDMVGNVWEHCLDHYIANRQALSSQIDPEGPTAAEAGTTGRLIRGGSFCEPILTTEQAACRTAARYPMAHGGGVNKSGNVGFRIAMTAE